MSAASQISQAKLRGITGDNHDRERIVVSIDMPAGAVTRFSLTIKDLKALGEMVECAIPNFAEAWRRRDEAQR
ncbi:hypothetical protein [uncultured Ruegeria sp.]|uniref:hypothetical protein n=1 Tax=uncultured Ruegeria sp. TaxID=259304 RepID=UPI0026252228|nr:hypothetical protein [uncultured Ruegeria sp.]